MSVQNKARELASPIINSKIARENERQIWTETWEHFHSTLSDDLERDGKARVEQVLDVLQGISTRTAPSTLFESLKNVDVWILRSSWSLSILTLGPVQSKKKNNYFCTKTDKKEMSRNMMTRNAIKHDCKLHECLVIIPTCKNWTGSRKNEASHALLQQIS